MLGLGLTALRTAVADPTFAEASWEFLAIGSRNSLPALPLRGGAELRPAPWVDYADDAKLLRKSDILLCPMLSPHTSYPVLEMAASGGIVVTNSFATKSEAGLTDISPNIVAVPATEPGFVQGLITAATRVAHGASGEASMNRPTDWRTALSAVAAELAARFRDIVAA